MQAKYVGVLAELQHVADLAENTGTRSEEFVVLERRRRYREPLAPDKHSALKNNGKHQMNCQREREREREKRHKKRGICSLHKGTGGKKSEKKNKIVPRKEKMRKYVGTSYRDS